MRSFGDIDRVIGHVPARVVTALSSVDIGRGSEALYRDQLPGLLSERRAALPGVSDQTIRLVLDRLRADGKIAVDGVGRSARWRRTRGA
jgi:hypothetical protein